MKFIRLLSTIIVLTSIYTVHANTDCKVRDKLLIPGTYTGKCVNGFAHGYGVAKHSAGKESYQGTFSRGLPHGQGKFTMAGDIIIGRFVNGKLNGKGKITFSNGDSYMGGFHSDSKHGYGVYRSNKGKNAFKGNYRYGKRHGKGQLIFDDGEVITGNWAGGKLNGYAVHKMKSGNVYKGTFRNNLRHGKGHMLSKNGKRVSGIWTDGKVSGGEAFEFVKENQLTSKALPKRRQATVTSRPSRPILRSASSGTNGCSVLANTRIVAQDGKFLGTISSEFDSTSVLNEFGTYGSEFSTNSIYNEFGKYGGEFSTNSPFNEFGQGAMLMRNGQIVGRLSLNKFLAGAVNPHLIKGCFK